jgi:hypothetical protein
MTDPVFDNTQAEQEGWSIFECHGSDNGLWQLQKCDDARVFASDQEAWAHVVDSADAGSAYHKLAILFLETFNPEEAACIKDAVYNHGDGL